MGKNIVINDSFEPRIRNLLKHIFLIMVPPLVDGPASNSGNPSSIVEVPAADDELKRICSKPLWRVHSASASSCRFERWSMSQPTSSSSESSSLKFAFTGGVIKMSARSKYFSSSSCKRTWCADNNFRFWGTNFRDILWQIQKMLAFVYRIAIAIFYCT